MTRDEIVTALRCCGNIECMKCRLPMNGFDTGTCRQMYAALRDTVLRRDEQIEKLAADRKDLINELCQYCGKYKHSHNGACDGCRWMGV